MQAGPPYFPFLDPAENRDGIEKADNQCPPLGRTEQPEPSQIDKGRAQKRDEQPVTARRFHTQYTGARHFGEFDCKNTY